MVCSETECTGERCVNNNSRHSIYKQKIERIPDKLWREWVWLTQVVWCKAVTAVEFLFWRRGAARGAKTSGAGTQTSVSAPCAPTESPDRRRPNNVSWDGVAPRPEPRTTSLGDRSQTLLNTSAALAGCECETSTSPRPKTSRIATPNPDSRHENVAWADLPFHLRRRFVWCHATVSCGLRVGTLDIHQGRGTLPGPGLCRHRSVWRDRRRASRDAPSITAVPSRASRFAFGRLSGNNAEVPPTRPKT